VGSNHRQAGEFCCVRQHEDISLSLSLPALVDWKAAGYVVLVIWGTFPCGDCSDFGSMFLLYYGRLSWNRRGEATEGSEVLQCVSGVSIDTAGVLPL
jgi:hypothetical protein